MGADRLGETQKQIQMNQKAVNRWVKMCKDHEELEKKIDKAKKKIEKKIAEERLINEQLERILKKQTSNRPPAIDSANRKYSTYSGFEKTSKDGQIFRIEGKYRQ